MFISSGKTPDFNFKTETLGELYSYKLLNSNKKEMCARLEHSIKDSAADKFVRTLISVCCHPNSSLDAEKNRPSDYSLSLDMIEDLTINDLETFSSLYIKHNDDIFRETITTSEPSREGRGTNLIIKLGDIEHPQNKDERCINYLHRVSVLIEEKERKQAKRMMRKLGITGFSKSLQDRINMSIEMGNQLRNTMKSIGHVKHYDHSTSINQHIELAKNAEETRLRPFKELSGKLDELIKSSNATTDFIVETNEIQASIAAELENAGEKNTLFALITIVISITIIGLTAFSLWVGYKSASLSSTVANRQIEVTDQYASEIIENLNEMNGYSKQSTKNSESSFEKLIEQQTTFIKELKDIRLQEEKRLELLLKISKEKN